MAGWSVADHLRTERIDHVGSYVQTARAETIWGHAALLAQGLDKLRLPRCFQTDDCLSSDFIPSHRLTPFPPDHFWPDLTAVTAPLYPGTHIAEEATQL